jgi:hypothetical protein
MYKNNKSGFTGVVWNKAMGQWKAYIQICGENIYLGGFGSGLTGKMLALAARKNAEEKYGFHPNHGVKRLQEVT